jgi:hypothetical protein
MFSTSNRFHPSSLSRSLGATSIYVAIYLSCHGSYIVCPAPHTRYTCICSAPLPRPRAPPRGAVRPIRPRARTVRLLRLFRLVSRLAPLPNPCAFASNKHLDYTVNSGVDWKFVKCGDAAMRRCGDAGICLSSGLPGNLCFPARLRIHSFVFSLRGARRNRGLVSQLATPAHTHEGKATRAGAKNRG